MPSESTILEAIKALPQFWATAQPERGTSADAQRGAAIIGDLVRRDDVLALLDRSSDPEGASFATRLRSARESLGMTQADLARAVDRSRASISNIEAGAQDPPLSLALALARAVGMKIENGEATHGQ